MALVHLENQGAQNNGRLYRQVAHNSLTVAHTCRPLALIRVQSPVTVRMTARRFAQRWHKSRHTDFYFLFLFSGLLS